MVYCKPTIRGPEQVLDYLGRYIHRIAMSNRRILSVDDGQVTFRYQKVDASAWKTMTLPAVEFIGRFLQHVLPTGVHKVRYYGLWSPARRGLLRQVQLLLAGQTCAAAWPAQELPTTPVPGNGSSRARTCPCCGRGRLVRTARIPRQERAPP